MPITTCAKVEWKDICLNGAILKDTEDIPIHIEVLSVSNPSIAGSDINFTFLTENDINVKSTTDSSITRTLDTSNKIELSFVLEPSDFTDITAGYVKYGIKYYIDITTPDTYFSRIGSGKFFIEETS